MAHDVFISHSSKDKAIADAVCAGLEARGIRCWIAPRDVLPGMEWTRAIVDAISGCKVFLLIFTDHSNQSTQAIKEVDLAVNHEKTIIPFRLENIKPTGSMEYYLSALHWLDALTPPVEKHIGKLSDYIYRILDASKELPVQQETQNLNQPKEEIKANPQASQIPALSAENKKPQPVTIPDGVAKNKPKKGRNGWLIAGLAAGVAVIGFLVWSGFKFLPGLITEPTSAMTSEIKPSPTSQSLLESYDLVKTRVSEVDGMVMVYVPAGEFQMGSLEGEGEPSEFPKHTVYLDAFWIDQTEVTNAMYAQCMAEGGCSKPLNEDSVSLLNFPVTYVNWEQAEYYCSWASRRLPTEAEWEKAASGIDSRKYPWGNEFDCSRGNFDDETVKDSQFVTGGPDCDGFKQVAPVGSYPEGTSPYGAMDMTGNVWEWVADWYGAYSSGYVTNPKGPETGLTKVLRGGSWFSNETNSNTSVRASSFTGQKTDSYGFRCATDDAGANTPSTTPMPAWMEEVNAWANPILAAIEEQPPVFEDNFSQIDSNWNVISDERYCPAFDPARKFIVINGKLHLEINPPCQFFSFTHPKLSTQNGDFVMRMDIDFAQAELGYEFIASNQKGIVVNFILHRKGWALTIPVPGTEEGMQTVQEGAVPADIAKPVTFTVLKNDATFLFYLDEMLLMAYDIPPEDSGTQEIRLLVTDWNDQPLTESITIDNIQFWDLNDLFIPERFLALIENQQPAFVDDFSSVDPAWQFLDNISGTYFPKNADFEITNGLMKLYLGNLRKSQGGELIYPEMNYSDYVLQTDVHFLDDQAYIEFRTWDPLVPEYYFWLTGTGEWAYYERNEEIIINNIFGEIPLNERPDFSKPFTLTIINDSPFYVVYLNSSLLFSYSQQLGTGPSKLGFAILAQAVSFSKETLVVELDNIKIWDVTGRQ